jgi:hypothetical protein
LFCRILMLMICHKCGGYPWPAYSFPPCATFSDVIRENVWKHGYALERINVGE